MIGLFCGCWFLGLCSSYLLWSVRLRLLVLFFGFSWLGELWLVLLVGWSVGLCSLVGLLVS